MTAGGLLPVLMLMIIATTIDLVTSGQSPILLVPGWTDSQLEGRISDGSSCDTGGEWLSYWVNENMSAECVNKVLTLQYNDTDNRYSNMKGVEVTVVGFGETSAVEYLDKNETKAEQYYHTIVEYFVSKGYERGKTIRAAPYDWRLAGDTLKDIGYYGAVKSLVEEMYSIANEKVSIVVHSMGGPVTLYFLNNIVTQDWKDKYIKAFVPLSGAWSGGNGILATYISALRSGREKPFGKSFQVMESTAWLLPNPLVWKDKPIVTTESATYTALDYKKLLQAMNRSSDYDRLVASFAIDGNYTAPNVSVYCYYGTDTPTVEVVRYGRDFPVKPSSATLGNGDGEVNIQSSEVCLKWSSQQQAPFVSRKFPLVTHTEMVTSSKVLEAVAEAINN